VRAASITLPMEIDYIEILRTPTERLALAAVLGFGCSIEDSNVRRGSNYD
jgi:hypothetical protein